MSSTIVNTLEDRDGAAVIVWSAGTLIDGDDCLGYQTEIHSSTASTGFHLFRTNGVRENDMFVEDRMRVLFHNSNSTIDKWDARVLDSSLAEESRFSQSTTKSKSYQE
ncbi:hypothetical protein Tco_0467613 [Tanacetum coccineum]